MRIINLEYNYWECKINIIFRITFLKLENIANINIIKDITFSINFS
jgi:hypothetical protein